MMKRANIFWMLTAILALLWGGISMAQEENTPAATEAETPTARIEETTITTPSADKLISSATPAPVQTISADALNAQESKDLTKRSQFWYRNKQLLLRPTSAGFADTKNELFSAQESQFRYYFDVAGMLYNEGRLEEAQEILEYLSQTHPNDEYLLFFLSKIKKELSPEDAQWLNKAKNGVRDLKRNEIKRLTEEGKSYFEQKNFDDALLKFTDVLALDPGNKTAQSYMTKLRDFYSKEIRTKNIVDNLPNKLPLARDENNLRPPADELLDKTEQKAAPGKNADPAQKILDDAEFKLLVLEKKALKLMNSTELDSRVKKIVSQKQYEERKSIHMTFGVGDIVRVLVNNHPELSGETIIGLNGYIFMPVTNEAVPAKGLTLAELTEKVTVIVNKYVRNPLVNVEIVDYRSKIFYVVDESGCTVFPITKANLTLLDALFISDWGDNRALGRVLVITPSTLKPIIKKVNAYDLIFRGKLASNVQIRNGDIIYIPTTIVGKFDDVMTRTFAPFSNLNNGVNTMRTLRGQRSQTWSNVYTGDNIQ